MNYYAFDIKNKTPEVAKNDLNTEGGVFMSEENEILIAVLNELPFESFEENTNGVRAFIRESELTEDIENQLVALGEDFDFLFEKTFLPAQNWNEIWESNFQPIRVDNFVGVRADFHPNTEGVVFDLLINPKMAFGTGHHETTFMMMQHMEAINFVGKKVLDYGCGTGVLAILASKLRASTIEAVDIELASFENTIENCNVNNVENVKALHGTLDVVASDDFNIILGNINRNVLLDSFHILKKKSVAGGLLLISGFLEEDLGAMRVAFFEHKLLEMRLLQRGKWLSILLRIEEQ